MSKDSSHTFALNAVIGFLSLLLCLLVSGLVSRLVYPRLKSHRAQKKSPLISNVIQLEVLNGCGIGGLADKVTATLRENGFDVVESGNYKNFGVKHTLVISRTLAKDESRRVAQALGVKPSHILVEASPDYYLDATIVIGSDYKSLNFY